MKDRTYLRVLLCVIGLCLVLTLAHMVYAVAHTSTAPSSNS